MTDLCVYLVSNRRERADKLASAIRLVLPCRLLDPAQPRAIAAGPPPLAFVIDLFGREDDATDALAARIRASGAPCLLVARQGETADSPHVRRFGTPILITAAAQSSGIIATLVRLAEGAKHVEGTKRAEGAGSAGRGETTDRAERADTRLDARLDAATAIVTSLFAAAARRRAPAVAEAEEGTEIVLAAVSEAGIGAWLERLRRHHAGVYQHSLSVAGLAAAFGDRLGLSRRDRQRLAQSALLHDVGKALIPVAILDKPGPLDPEEERVMRRHAALGAEVLDGAGYAPEILDVVRHHHERLDGSGYPDALRGQAIGDLVRLVAICDVHAALTERRVYRPALSAAQARPIMAGMAGQLDADLLRGYGPVIDRAACEPCEA